jgi:mRNA interferase YafQ
MRTIEATRRYRRDYKQAHKRGLDLDKIDAVIDHITEHGEAPAATRPHKLSGNWADAWDCHIEPDWILIYDVTDDTVELIRTGTHSDLFG